MSAGRALKAVRLQWGAAPVVLRAVLDRRRLRLARPCAAESGQPRALDPSDGETPRQACQSRPVNRLCARGVAARPGATEHSWMDDHSAPPGQKRGLSAADIRALAED